MRTSQIKSLLGLQVCLAFKKLKTSLIKKNKLKTILIKKKVAGPSFLCEFSGITNWGLCALRLQALFPVRASEGVKCCDPTWEVRSALWFKDREEKRSGDGELQRGGSNLGQSTGEERLRSNLETETVGGLSGVWQWKWMLPQGKPQLQGDRGGGPLKIFSFSKRC